MKAKPVNIIWGIALVIIGGLFLAYNLGAFGTLPLNFWLVAFAGASLLFFITYLVSGIKEWGWLFPACIFAGVATTTWLVLSGYDGSLLGVPVLLGVALPFLVAFALNWRENWWALIPAWSLIVIAAIVGLESVLPSELMGTMILWSIALPFLVVYLWNRQNWWALIPAGVLGAVGVIPLLAYSVQGEWLAAAILVLIGVPFLVVYLLNRKHWWALIPAGVLLSVAVTSLITSYLPAGTNTTALANGLIYIGIGATFGVLWLLRDTHDTGWAKYPAIGVALFGLVVLTIGISAEFFLAALFIAVGCLVLVLTLRQRKS